MHWLPIKDLDKYKTYPYFFKEYFSKPHDGIIHIITDDRKQVIHMINLIKKETYTEKELKELDLYFDTHIEEFFDLDNDIIVRFITACENTLGYSLTNVTFENHVCSIICDEK